MAPGPVLSSSDPQAVGTEVEHIETDKMLGKGKEQARDVAEVGPGRGPKNRRQ